MKKVIRLTESDLARIVRRVIRENEDVDNYFVDEESIYNTGANAFQTVRGTDVWLQSDGLSNWPAGESQLAKKSAQKLKNAISGLDISGSGRSKMWEVAKEWANFNLKTQNEFLKEYSKLSKQTPWKDIFDDYENDIVDAMINRSIKKVHAYCDSYAIKKTEAYRNNTTSSFKPDVICDTFVTNDLRAPGWKGY